MTQAQDGLQLERFQAFPASNINGVPETGFGFREIRRGTSQQEPSLDPVQWWLVVSYCRALNHLRCLRQRGKRFFELPRFAIRFSQQDQEKRAKEEWECR